MYRHFRKQLIFRLMPLFILSSLLLIACGENAPAATSANPAQPNVALTPAPGQGQPNPQVNANSAAATLTAGGKVGPITGADGQITVIAPPATGGTIPGLFTWVSQNNIWIGGTKSQAGPVTPDTLGGKAITKVAPLAQAISPNISPDASQVAYGYSPEPEGTPGNIVIGQDIWIYDLKANSAKMVIKRDEPQTFLDEPIWSADSKYLYFSYRTPVRNAKNVVTGEKIGIDRLELASGTREKLFEDGRYPAPLPDGKSIVYIGTDASGGSYETELKSYDIATKKSKTLLNRNSGFLSYYVPRPSPNGDMIVFAAAGGPDLSVVNPAGPGQPGPLPGATTGAGQNPLASALFNNLGVGIVGGRPQMISQNRQNSASYHGLPFDLWLVKPDGTNVRRLTTLFEDQPVPAWSKDGKQIMFVAGLGLYTVDADGKNLVKKSDKGAHGGFDWKN